MKGEFISKFIKGVVSAGKDIYTVYNWTPIYYKGFLVSGYSRKKLYSGFKNLEHRGIIKEIKDGKYKFTERGKMWFRLSLLRYHKESGTKWDNKWRIVLFDIPQEFHNKRNQFRRKLKQLGFYMIQKSVFAFPYPCEEELARYCEELKISDYINIVKADSLGFVDDEVKNIFNL